MKHKNILNKCYRNSIFEIVNHFIQNSFENSYGSLDLYIVMFLIKWVETTANRKRKGKMLSSRYGLYIVLKPFLYHKIFFEKFIVLSLRHSV